MSGFLKATALGRSGTGIGILEDRRFWTLSHLVMQIKQISISLPLIELLVP